MRINRNVFLNVLILLSVVFVSSCTVKAVGDPKRPITIEAHVVLDIKGLKDTATNIEDYVSGSESKKDQPVNNGGKNAS